MFKSSAAEDKEEGQYLKKVGSSEEEEQWIEEESFIEPKEKPKNEIKSEVKEDNSDEEEEEDNSDEEEDEENSNEGKEEWNKEDRAFLEKDQEGSDSDREIEERERRRKQPCHVPRSPYYFHHDLRLSDEDDKSFKVLSHKWDRAERSKGADWEEKWTHDLFKEDEQQPKTRREIEDEYGCDIRVLSPEEASKTNGTNRRRLRVIKGVQGKGKEGRTDDARRKEDMSTLSVDFKELTLRTTQVKEVKPDSPRILIVQRNQEAGLPSGDIYQERGKTDSVSSTEVNPNISEGHKPLYLGNLLCNYSRNMSAHEYYHRVDPSQHAQNLRPCGNDSHDALISSHHGDSSLSQFVFPQPPNLSVSHLAPSSFCLYYPNIQTTGEAWMPNIAQPGKLAWSSGHLPQLPYSHLSHLHQQPPGLTCMAQRCPVVGTISPSLPHPGYP